MPSIRLSLDVAATGTRAAVDNVVADLSGMQARVARDFARMGAIISASISGGLTLGISGGEQTMQKLVARQIQGVQAQIRRAFGAGGAGWTGGAGAGGSGGASGGGRGSGGSGGGAGGWSMALPQLASVTYLIRQTADASAALGRAIGGVASKFVEVTEQARLFEISIAGVVGGLTQARALDYDLVRASAKSPLSVSDLRTAGVGLLGSPELAARLSLASPSQGAAQIAQYGELAARLTQLNPSMGEQGAVIALRRLMEGGASSQGLRRFGITPGMLAQFASPGATAKDLQTNPQLGVQGLQKLLDTVFPAQLFDERAKLISTRIQKIKDAIDQGLLEITNSRVYDDVSAKLGAVADGLFKYIDTPQFMDKANQIGGGLSGIFGNAVGGAQQLLGSLSGKDVTGTADSTLGAASALIAQLNDLSKGLPDLGKEVGGGLRSIAQSVADAVGVMRELRDAMPKGTREVSGFAGTTLSAGLSAAKILIHDNLLKGLYTGVLGAYTTPTSGGATAESLPTTKPSVPGSAISDVPDSMQKLMEFTPNFGSTLEATAALMQRITSSAQTSAFEKLSQTGSTLFKADLSLDPNNPMVLGDALENARGMYNSQKGQLDDALSQAHAAAAGEAHPSQELLVGMASLAQKRQQLEESFNAVKSGITDNITTSVREFAVALAATLKDLPPEARLALQREITAGTIDLAQQARELLHAHGDMAKAYGLTGLPIDQQLRLLNEFNASSGEAVKARGQYGNVLGLANSATASQIESLRPDNARTLGVAGQQALQAQLSQMEGLQSRALAAFQNAPAGDKDHALANLQATDVALAKLAEQLRNIRFESDETAKAFVKFGDDVQNSIDKGFGKALGDALLGMGSFRDAMKGIAQEIVRSFADNSVHAAISGLFSNLPSQGNGQAGGLGGLFKNLLGFADGGVVPGGLNFGNIPFRAFSSGGIVDSPTLALAGEGRYSEAVVPLPNGRSIPVDMRGGGSMSYRPPDVVVYNVSNVQQAIAQGYRENKHILIDQMAEDVAKGGKLGKVIKRTNRQ